VLERSIALAESLTRRDSILTGTVALWASRFVQGRTTDSYETATRALALIHPDSEPSSPAHFAVGGSAVSLGRPAEAVRYLELAGKLTSGAMSLSIGTRPDVQATAWAAHAHWRFARRLRLRAFSRLPDASVARIMHTTSCRPPTADRRPPTARRLTLTIGNARAPPGSLGAEAFAHVHCP
jgi:hypothetical protein